MANYTARNWSSGDIVTAANLSSIERGVSAVAEEYTPTTWANGNTVTAASLNNIEQGIANAGGSSDFSTAQVTITDNTTQGQNIQVPWVIDSQGMQAAGGVRGTQGSGSVDSYDIILYKGKCILVCNPFYTVTTSGSVEELDGGSYLITGDCTITISDSSSGGVK